MATGTGSPFISIPAAAGAGVRSPARSQLLPGATASIAHARILAEEREPDKARYFHEIIKEQL